MDCCHSRTEAARSAQIEETRVPGIPESIENELDCMPIQCSAALVPFAEFTNIAVTTGVASRPEVTLHPSNSLFF